MVVMVVERRGLRDKRQGLERLKEMEGHAKKKQGKHAKQTKTNKLKALKSLVTYSRHCRTPMHTLVTVAHWFLDTQAHSHTHT